MAKDNILRIRIKDEDKENLNKAAAFKNISASELSREAIINKVKRILKEMGE